MRTTNLENLDQAELDYLLHLVLSAPLGAPHSPVAKLADKIRDAQTNLSASITIANQEIIDGIRDNYLCDEYFSTDVGASADEEDRNEADNKAVATKVVSVKDATDAIAEEICNAFAAQRKVS